MNWNKLFKSKSCEDKMKELVVRLQKDEQLELILLRKNIEIEIIYNDIDYFDLMVSRKTSGYTYLNIIFFKKEKTIMFTLLNDEKIGLEIKKLFEQKIKKYSKDFNLTRFIDAFEA